MTPSFKYHPAALPPAISVAGLAILCSALFLGACTRNAAVISSDGTEELGLCDMEVTTCIDRLCPQGAKPLRGATKIVDGPLLVRCLNNASAKEIDGGLW